MARRARQGVNPVQIAIIAGIVAVVGGGLVFALTRTRDSMRSVSELDIAEYIEKGDSMGGTVWRVTGTVDKKERWTPDRGQLLNMSIDQGGLIEILPVLVPPDFNDLSINVGDRFTMKVEVGDKILLTALDIVRS